MPDPEILISAGEPSGEMHAARLAEALRHRTGTHLFGLGGLRMREAGVELVADIAQVSVVGITEVVRRLPAVWRVYRALAAEAIARRPKLAILVDFPDFNLRLARRLHQHGIRIVYFISPQVWAWRPKRVRLIKRLIERMICIFPFEEKFYRDAGVRVDYVGHPLVDVVHSSSSRQAFSDAWKLDAAKTIVTLLPGSRMSEVRHNLPPILAADRQLGKVVQYVLALAPGLPASVAIQNSRPEQPSVSVVSGATYDALAAADLAIVASGTATVESALLGTPMVVVYRVSGTTAFIARRLVRTPFFSMVNLIAGRRIVPELIQDDFTPDAVAREARRLLESDAAREEMKHNLAEVRTKLGPGGAIDRAAEIISGMM